MEDKKILETLNEIKTDISNLHIEIGDIVSSNFDKLFNELKTINATLINIQRNTRG